MIFAQRGKLEYPGKLSKNKTKMDSISTNAWLKCGTTPLHTPAAFTVFTKLQHEHIFICNTIILLYYEL